MIAHDTLVEIESIVAGARALLVASKHVDVEEIAHAIALLDLTASKLDSALLRDAP